MFTQYGDFGTYYGPYRSIISVCILDVCRSTHIPFKRDTRGVVFTLNRFRRVSVFKRFE